MSQAKKTEKKSNQPKRIALYVIYDKDGILDGFRKYYLQELKKVTDHVVAVVSGTLTPESRVELEDLVDEIYVRENKGLLAGAWIDGIAHVGWDELYTYDELLMLNDSFFGPFYPLSEMFDAMEESDADFYGAMRNFEEKSFTQFAGRDFKHGWCRGSIPYFYIIKRRLLHSPEFRKYWSQMPEVKEDWDTYFFAEWNFHDYVLDCGFKVDSYQTDKLKGYCFDNVTLNSYKLIKEDRVPFARVRPFGTDMRDYSLVYGYGKDARQSLEYVDKHTDYNTDYIWDFLLRTKNLTHLYNQLELEYIVPRDIVEKKFTYSKHIAVILHIYYKDMVEEMAQYCENFIENTDFFISTTDEETEAEIKKAFDARKLKYELKVRPNIGLGLSSLWVTYANVVLEGKYEYICYFHDKKSPYSQFAMNGEQFAARCYENLFGTKEVVKNIVNLFEENTRLGVLGAPAVYHGGYLAVPPMTWPVNYENTKKLADRLDMNVNINPNIAPVAPYGDMFWFRSDALKKVIGKGLTYDDLDVDFKKEKDGTILHAIERIYGFAAQDSGYYYADVIHSDNARTDLINYKYMMEQLCEIMLANGHVIHNFEAMKMYMRQYKGAYIPWRMRVKGKLKKILPNWMWNLMKKVYMSLGGKKWIG